ncbi:MAG: YecH family protein [Nibricoccus sp.]
MQESIHGHEVIGMMVESGKTYTIDTLCADIVQRFGPDARFHTCSADNLTPKELIVFLDSRGKLTAVEGGFVFGAGQACGHGDHEH